MPNYDNDDEEYGKPEYDYSDYDDYADDDDYDYGYHVTRNWRYRLLNFRYRLRWLIWSHFKRCPYCGNRNKNCTCIPF